MTQSDEETARIRTLARIARRQLQHLEYTDKRIFAGSTTAEILQELRDNPEFAERVDAFVSRFGRLQDTLGNKLLPALLAISGEPVNTALNNLDRAENLAGLSQRIAGSRRVGYATSWCTIIWRIRNISATRWTPATISSPCLPKRFLHSSQNCGGTALKVVNACQPVSELCIRYHDPLPLTTNDTGQTT